MTEKQVKTIIYLLGETRNPYEIQRDTGRPIGQIRTLMRTEEMEPLPGWGRLELQRHIVSRRHVAHPWPAKDLVTLQETRRLHDQGKVTMCQGRDGEYIIQYAIPTRRTISRTPYFYGAPL